MVMRFVSFRSDERFIKRAEAKSYF